MKRFLTLAALSGCSLTTMRKPQSGVASDASCTKSRLAPAIDTAIVAGEVIGAGVTLAVTDRDQPAQNAIVGGLVLTGVLFLASAGNGYRWARECRAQVK